MSADVETIVVGAGVVGLAVARALALAGHEMMVLEQHELIGSETSSRNSEVIHAGIYYPPGSLRATLCVRGKELLYAFCAENSVAHARCGKLLVATSESQLPKLAAIRETAAKNGVTDLEPLGGNAARALEPEVACVAALLSPSTGIIDSHGFMLALEGHIEANGGSVVLRCPVERIERDAAGPVPPDDRRRQSRRHHLPATSSISAGLHASKLARTLGLRGRLPARPRPTTPRASTTRSRAARPSSATSTRCPTAPGSACTPPSTSAGAASSAPTSPGSPTSTTASSRRSSSKFLDFIRSYYPGLEVDAPAPRLHGHPPQALPRRRAGARLRHPRRPRSTAQDGLVALYGIESPGLTASLAIGEVVAGLLARRG